MTANDATDKLIPLELPLDELVWLRAFLDQERSAADVDRQDINELHSILPRRAAMGVLVREQETMTKIIDEICRTIDAIDERESLARKIAAMTPPVA